MPAHTRQVRRHRSAHTAERWPEPEPFYGVQYRSRGHVVVMGGEEARTEAEQRVAEAPVGERLTLCRKVMGRRRDEPLVRIVDVEVIDVRRELAAITADDVALEGLAPMTPAEFVEFFCSTHKGCTPDTEVTRIEWRYLP